MTHIRTRSGEHFDFADPCIDAIKIEDIAHSLARLCRFNGHCLGFISVAQHSVWCSRTAQARSYDRQVQRWALMHDAAEAYVGDVPSPLKAILPDFQYVEARVQSLIAKRFQLGHYPEAVHQIDRDALAFDFGLFASPSYLSPNEWAGRFLDECARLEIR